MPRNNDSFLMDKLINGLNRYESPILIAYIVLYTLFLFLGNLLFIPYLITTLFLALFYWLQGDRAYKLMGDKTWFIRVFALVLGFSSSLVLIGSLAQLRNWPIQPVTTVGMLGIIGCCLALFYHPIQDEYLPILKKILLRLFLLVLVGLTSAA